MGAYFSEKNNITGLLDPVSSSSGAIAPHVVNMSNYRRANFLVYLGAVGGGTGVMTVSAGTTTSVGTAIACRYQASSSATGAEVLSGTMTTLPAAGITIGGTANMFYLIEVLDTDLGATQPYVAVRIATGLTTTLISCVAILSDARYPQANFATALT